MADEIEHENPDSKSDSDYLPLLEAKMVHQYNHRYGDFHGFQLKTDAEYREIPQADPQTLAKVDYEITPRYWVARDEVLSRVPRGKTTAQWLLGFRDITNATNQRTVIFAAVPTCGVGNNFPIVYLDAPNSKIAAFLGNANSLVLDFVARGKVGGTHLNYIYLKQLPILSPTSYGEDSLAFIVPRVLELTYASYSMTPFARDLGYSGEPFPWDEDRRALLRAELDAWYARAYGLSRDDLRYILDPADPLGPDYPSETFRVLKKNEIAKFGEYRTQRLVLAAWDRQAAGQPPISELGREPIVLTPTHEVSS
jgi:hypothetical protein